MLRKKWLKYASDMSQKQKSYERFYNAIKTDATICNYSYCMERFMKFLKSKDHIDNIEHYDKLLDFDTDKITDVLEAFVSYLKLTQKRNSINAIISAPELFFDMNRKTWYRKLVRKTNNKTGGKLGGQTPITTDEIQMMLNSTMHLREKAFIHFLASTGIRPAAIVDPVLRISHLVYMPNPDNPSRESKWCYAVRIYDDSDDEGYWAFLTPESTIALDRYFGWRKNIRHEEFDDETPIFAQVRNKNHPE